MKKNPRSQHSFSADEPSMRSADDVIKALGADVENGLTSQEALRRLAADGPNELSAKPALPNWRRILAHFQDPLIYLLLVAIAISLIAWGIEGWAGWPIDAIVIAIVVILNGVLGFVQEAKAEQAVAALARTTAVSSAVVRDGQTQRVPSATLVRGDLLVLVEGDAVGADDG